MVRIKNILGFFFLTEAYNKRKIYKKKKKFSRDSPPLSRIKRTKNSKLSKQNEYNAINAPVNAPKPPSTLSKIFTPTPSPTPSHFSPLFHPSFFIANSLSLFSSKKKKKKTQRQRQAPISD